MTHFHLTMVYGRLMDRIYSVGESNAMTLVNAYTLDEGRPMSRPQVACIALNRHPFGFDSFSVESLSDACGYNGEKDAYRRHTRGRNACGGGRRK